MQKYHKIHRPVCTTKANEYQRNLYKKASTGIYSNHLKNTSSLVTKH